MTLVEMYKAIKEIAEESGLVSEVKLIKSDTDISEVMDNGVYRKLLISAKSAKMYSEDDEFVFHVLIFDKTKEDETQYLNSINDGMSLVRTITTRLFNEYGNRVDVENIVVNSGKSNTSLMTSIDFDLSFEYQTIVR